MSAQLNHTIVLCKDQSVSARFLAEMLDRPEPLRAAPFHIVPLDNGVSMDFMNSRAPVVSQHYAFLIDEADFDGVLGRIRSRGIEHWADPSRSRPGEINRRDGGRGVYFLDPDGHFLEVLTRAHAG